MSRKKKFLTRVVTGFVLGVGAGWAQFGWSSETAPIVWEYGVVFGAMAFAVTNYLELRAKIMDRARAGTLAETRKP